MCAEAHAVAIPIEHHVGASERSVAVPRVDQDFFRYLLYPFTILATWFHEMGHGLCAMLLGGTFVSLRLFPDGSGYAVHSGSPFLGQLGLALIAAAGPLGPALAGASLIFLSVRPRWSRLGLTGVALVMLLSALIWIRTLFGVSLIVLLALVLLLIRFKGTNRWHSLTLQFIGVQACISVFLNIGYLFTENVWAILLTGLTLWLPAWSLSRALRATGRAR
jgi:hypothetical protein